MKIVLATKLIFILFALLLFNSGLDAQQLQRHEAVVAYIYNFAKNIQWHEENKITEFYFLLFGEDKNLLEELRKLSNSKSLKGKPIRISSTKNVDAINNFHLVFMTKSEEAKLADVFDRIEGENTLLVSDDFADKRLIMINLFQNKQGNLLFEINKANVLNQRLKVLPDMILLGGTEIDVAELYREGQQNLRQLQKQIQQLENSLSNLEKDIELKSKEIEQQKINLELQSDEISKQENILDEQSEKIRVYETEIKKQLTELEKQHTLFAAKAKQLDEQKKELIDGSIILQKQKMMIDEQDKAILEQTGQIEKQQLELKKQESFLYFLIIILLLAVVLAFIFYKWYQNKNRMNTVLEEMVKRKTNQLQELNHQLLLELNETKRLEEEEKKLSQAIEQTADSIIITDNKGVIHYVNPAFEKLTGYRLEEVVFKTPRVLKSGVQDKAFYEKLWGTILSGKEYQVEIVNRRKTGELFIEVKTISPIKNSEGEITHFVSTGKDITEKKRIEEELEKHREHLEELVATRTIQLQKAKDELQGINDELIKEIEIRVQAEKSLKASEKRLEDILNYAPILVYINDLEGRYLFINKEFEKLEGLKNYAVVGKTDLELFTPNRAERNIAQNKKVLETKQAQMFENKSIKPEGDHYFVDILFPIFDSNGEVYATCGWSIDITARKKSEQILTEAKEKAEEADRMKSAFLATMSHELRTPLNSIIGFTGILMRQIPGPLNDEQLKQLGMAKKSANHLLDLINDVLDISKIEAGQLVVSSSKFNFKKMIEQIISIAKPLAEKKNLKLELYVSDEIAEITSDERRVGQIFLNLVNNAIKFTERGSVKVFCEKNGTNIISKVIDTGIGMKPPDLDKLFKPFSQIDIGTSRQHEGTGLGLSISQRLADKLGGEILVESEFGSGSTFTVILPIENKSNE